MSILSGLCWACLSINSDVSWDEGKSFSARIPFKGDVTWNDF